MKSHVLLDLRKKVFKYAVIGRYHKEIGINKWNIGFKKLIKSIWHFYRGFRLKRVSRKTNKASIGIFHKESAEDMIWLFWKLVRTIQDYLIEKQNSS